MLYDIIRIVFIFTLLVVSLGVIIFRILYIDTAKEKNFFYILLFIFLLSIWILIILPDFLTLVIGWDGLGLTSFFLVAYYRHIRRLSAAIITIIMNRLGDRFILFGLAILWCKYLNFVLGIWFIIIICITKRAQIPFSAWLPAAIAAPTPISALVHSSTLVTAGVFIIVRFYFILPYTVKNFTAIIGFFTTLLSSILACIEIDFKKVIALSTLRNLGLIFFRLRLDSGLCFYHLIVHAFFKAYLFILAGYFIYYRLHRQDIRYTIGLNRHFIIRIFFITNLLIARLPFLGGYYRKELIIHTINNNFKISLLFLITIGIIFFFTYFYSFRLINGLLNPSNKIYLINYLSGEKNFLISLLVLILIGVVVCSWCRKKVLLFHRINGSLLVPTIALTILLGRLFIRKNKYYFATTSIIYLKVWPKNFVGLNTSVSKIVASYEIRWRETFNMGRYILIKVKLNPIISHLTPSAPLFLVILCRFFIILLII